MNIIDVFWKNVAWHLGNKNVLQYEPESLRNDRKQIYVRRRMSDYFRTGNFRIGRDCGIGG